MHPLRNWVVSKCDAAHVLRRLPRRSDDCADGHDPPCQLLYALSCRVFLLERLGPLYSLCCRVSPGTVAAHVLHSLQRWPYHPLHWLQFLFALPDPLRSGPVLYDAVCALQRMSEGHLQQLLAGNILLRLCCGSLHCIYWRHRCISVRCCLRSWTLFCYWCQPVHKLRHWNVSTEHCKDVLQRLPRWLHNCCVRIYFNQQLHSRVLSRRSFCIWICALYLLCRRFVPATVAGHVLYELRCRFNDVVRRQHLLRAVPCLLRRRDVVVDWP